MGDKVESAQRSAFLSITRCFRTTNTATVQVLAGALTLNLQVEKKSHRAHVLRLNRYLNFGQIHFSEDKIEGKFERIHPARAPVFDWVESPQINEGIDRWGLSVYTNRSKTDFRVGSGVVIYENIVLW